VNKVLITALLLSAPCLQPAVAADAPAPVPGKVPAGNYTLDKPHASLIFRVSHMGFSHYTARFTTFDAKLHFDPTNAKADEVTVTIDPASLTPDNPPPGFAEALRGAQWLNAGQFPQITFRSTRVQAVGENGLRVTGDFTLHGVTKPVVLEARYNGGYAGHPFDPHARVGFSAHGTLNRSDFGIAFGIPQPGSNMGVGDAVDFTIEAEFSGPPLPSAGPAASGH